MKRINNRWNRENGGEEGKDTLNWVGRSKYVEPQRKSTVIDILLIITEHFFYYYIYCMIYLTISL